MTAAVAGSPAAPDGEVMARGGDFIGLGVLNTSGDGQTAKAKVERGKRTSFTFRFVNNGGAVSDLNVGGCTPPDEFEVTYKSEGADITDDVNGGLFTYPDAGSLEPLPVLKAKVKVPNATPRGFADSTCVPVVAQEPPNNRDEPEWRVRVK